MFTLNAKLKEYAVKNLGVKADATDAEYTKSLTTAVASGKVKYKDIGPLMTKTAPTKPVVRPVPVKTVVKPVAVKTVTRPAFNPAELNRLVNARVDQTIKQLTGGTETKNLAPETLMYKANKVRVKAAVEQYDSCRKSAIYPDRCGVNGRGSKNVLGGQQARLAGRDVYHPSNMDKAIIAAYQKWMVAPLFQHTGVPENWKMRDHEKDLITHALHECEWTGMIGKSRGQEIGVDRKKLDDFMIKTILNDSTSGGVEISPYMFDDAIVLFPVLYGELFPHVNVVNTDRATIKSGKMNNPTITSGTAEGTAITPLTTTSFISAFDTTVWPQVGAVELGLDFEADSPVDVGGTLVERYGLVALQQLDRMIAYGNGTNEPLGLFLTTGAITANSDNGAAGPMTISDLSQLMFGLGKEYRTEAKAFQAYVMSDLMYRNIRDITVGPSDERRPLGIDYQNYEVIGVPCKVQNNIPAGRIAFVNLNRYRLYRRLGLQVRIETAGRTLALSNTKIIVCRQRYGGQMETGNAVCTMSDAQQ